MTLPAGFLWGCATSSHQVEDGPSGNDWDEWETAPGRIHDGTRRGAACGWWSGRAEQDLELAASMGHGAVRISLEWSRIEPREGELEDAALARYERIVLHARELGLVPIVGLNHFTLPRWLAERGSWLAADAPDRFARYADRCARRLRSVVDRWATLNEPSVLGLMGYAGTAWPPGRGDVVAAMRAIRAQLLAHGAAYRAVKEVSPSAQVGLVLNVPALDPADSSSPLDHAVTSAQDWVFSGVVLDALRNARFRAPLALRTEDAPVLRGALDWLGLNYYGRYRVCFDPRAASELFGRRLNDRTVRTEHNDWGEVHPEGLTRGLVRLSKLFPRLPLYVTENGLTTSDDRERAAYLRVHVAAVEDAVRAGVDVRGYLAWTLVDNFEWAEGWSTPFGLVELDRVTGDRRPRPSAAVFSEMIAAHRASPRPKNAAR